MLIGNYNFRNFLKETLCKLQQLLNYGSTHPYIVAQKHAAEDTYNYIANNMRSAIACYNEKSLIKLALSKLPEEGLILEFGVFKGGSINYIASQTKRPIYGFDTFTGLPEDWHGTHNQKSSFSTKANLPHTRKNVTLVIGQFEDTLATWLETKPGQKVAFLHIDSDLYSSCNHILNTLGDRIQSGTIIIFDEYFNYPFWRTTGEYKAFDEYVKKLQYKYIYIGYAHNQVAIKIL